MKTESEILSAIHNCNLRFAMCTLNTNDEGRKNGTLESYAFAAALQWVLGIESEGTAFLKMLLEYFEEMSPEQRDALAAMHSSFIKRAEEAENNASN